MRGVGILFLLFLTIWQRTIGQEYPKQEYDLENLADEIFPLQDTELNYDDLYENLLQRLANPLDLNTASMEELRSVFVLKEIQIQELLNYRQQGPFFSIYELQVVPSFDLNTIYRLIPFVQVGGQGENETLWKRIVQEKNNYLLLRYERTLEDKTGYVTPDTAQHYAGSPNKLYGRFRVSKAGDFSLGFTFEKDAGEPLSLNSSQRGFDFHSAHLQVNNQGKIKNAIVGDYQVQFGQGLVLGGGFGMGKGAESITTLRRSNLGFLPYTSANESGFFRGGAITVEPMRKTLINLFASSLPRDGSVELDSAENSSTSSFLLSGFHRTPREIRNRHQIRETNGGTSVEYRGNAFQAGALFHFTRYETPLIRNSSVYNQFSFQGNQNSNASLFFNYTFKNFTFFSESAHTLRHGNAAVAGLLGSISQALDVSILIRKYARNFHSFYSNALSENSSPQNESGIYWGLKYIPSKKTTVSGYVDLFRFPWLRFRGYSPSDGSEWLLKFHHRPSKTISAFIQLREEVKVRNLDTETTTYQTSNGRKRNLWINLDYSAGRMAFKSRLQYSQYQLLQTTNGLALIQDISLNMGKISVAARYALFDTDDFENRQYVYEKDVWLAYSLPAYNGTGIRAYVLLQFSLSRKVDLWLRWAQTTYQNQDFIGTGGEEIEGNSKNDVKFQARIRI